MDRNSMALTEAEDIKKVRAARRTRGPGFP